MQKTVEDMANLEQLEIKKIGQDFQMIAFEKREQAERFCDLCSLEGIRPAPFVRCLDGDYVALFRAKK